MTARWLIGGSVYSAMVLFIGITAAGGMISRHSAEATLTYTGVSRLDFDSTTATVTIRRGGSAVTVHRELSWSIGRPVVTQQQVGETLSVQAACGQDRGVRFTVNCVVTYEIEVPPDIDVAVSAESISVTGLTGTLDLTANGPITVTGRPATLTARSDAGQVDVRP